MVAVTVAFVLLPFLATGTLRAQETATSANQGQADANLQSAAPTSPQPLDFTEQVVRDVLETLQTGIASHNLNQALSIFDPHATVDYPHIRDEMRAFFAHYSDVRFRYKILQLTSDKDRGFVTSEIDLDATPLDENLMPLRRSTQMRFQLKQTPKGWKVVAFTPADFFAQ